MGYTLWIFILLPDGRVERYPRTQYEKFYDGEAALRAEVGAEAKFIELAIETRRGHPLRLVRAWFSRYQLRSDGFVSGEHQARRMRDAINAMDPGPANRADDVISLEPFIARQRNRLEHEWQASASELTSIISAINYDAAREIVTTDGRKVLPV